MTGQERGAGGLARLAGVSCSFGLCKSSSKEALALSLFSKEDCVPDREGLGIYRAHGTGRQAPVEGEVGGVRQRTPGALVMESGEWRTRANSRQASRETQHLTRSSGASAPDGYIRARDPGSFPGISEAAFFAPHTASNRCPVLTSAKGLMPQGAGSLEGELAVQLSSQTSIAGQEGTVTEALMGCPGG